MGARELFMESKANMSDKLDSENVFCTILTKGRLYQGLALLTSLNRVMGEDFFIFILCIDDESHSVLKKIKWNTFHLITEKELDAGIQSLKEERKIHEYCWTLKPVLCEHVMTNYSSIKRVTYLDSDLYFWENPNKIFKNQPNCSVLLSIEEKYKPNWKKASQRKMIKITGLYNSGFISFKQDKISLQSVKWWKDKCLESCKIAPEEGKFGDQKYLDELPSLFPNICAITTPGVNIGPWNYLKYQFSNVNDSIFIDDSLLIFYHFSSLRVVSKNKVNFVYRVNKKKLPFIYQIYIKAIKDIIDLVEKLDPNFNGFANDNDLQKYWN